MPLLNAHTFGGVSIRLQGQGLRLDGLSVSDIGRQWDTRAYPKFKGLYFDTLLRGSANSKLVSGGEASDPVAT